MLSGDPHETGGVFLGVVFGVFLNAFFLNLSVLADFRTRLGSSFRLRMVLDLVSAHAGGNMVLL